MADFTSSPDEIVNGAVIQLGSKKILLCGSLPEKLADKVLLRDQIVIRYAIPFIYEPDTFYIHRIVDDFGRDFREQAALDFAYHKGDAFPRAAVIGIRASSGKQ